jgi:hypothetical protein
VQLLRPEINKEWDAIFHVLQIPDTTGIVDQLQTTVYWVACGKNLQQLKPNLPFQFGHKSTILSA